jgi:hypothetical protein
MHGIISAREKPEKTKKKRKCPLDLGDSNSSSAQVSVLKGLCHERESG